MDNSKIVSIAILLFLLSPGILFAQSKKRKKSNDFHFEMSFSGGVSYAQSIKDMSDAMFDVGLDDDSQYYTYPNSEKEFGVLDLTLMYKWNAHSGIVLGGSILERFTVAGATEIANDENRLVLNTKVHQVRCQYQWRTSNSRFLMTIGPSLTFFNIVDGWPALFWQQTYSSSIPGLAGGIQYNVINLDAFFVSLSVNGQYTLPAEIDKFRAHQIFAPPSHFSKVVYQPDDIHFSNIGAFLGVGFRI